MAGVFFTIFTVSCRFISMSSDAPRRLSAMGTGLIIQDSIAIERDIDGTSINLTFETTEAANCKFGFYELSSGKKSTETPTDCSSSSALKFSETISPVAKDQLVAIVIRSWRASATESSGTTITIPETSPLAGPGKINFLLVDLNAHRIEITSVESAENPATLAAKQLGQTSRCVLNDSAAIESPLPRSSLALTSATSRGFINAPTTRESPTSLGGEFQVVQKQSSEWNISAKSASGFGQLRLARPALLASATFAGRDQSEGIEDGLEDIDVPAIKVNSTSTLVATWTLDGDGKNAVSIFTVAAAPGFLGITCLAPASDQKITIPAELVAKIPSGQRLWMTLRLDSWQPQEKARWLARVSDWRSMGVQKL